MNSEQNTREVTGWLTDRGTFHSDKTDAWNDSDGFIEPLYTAAQLSCVPDGWKLVPVKLSNNMAKSAGDYADSKWCICLTMANMRDLWTIMLDNTPEVN